MYQSGFLFFFLGLHSVSVIQLLFFSPTVYHDIDSKFKRTMLRMKKQNEGTSRCDKHLVRRIKVDISVERNKFTQYS